MIKLQNEYKLDNPVWHSLSESHQAFAIDYGAIKFDHPDHCPFGGYEKSEHISTAIDDYAMMADPFFIVGEKPALSEKMHIEKELVCLQMLIHDRIGADLEEDSSFLTTQYNEALFELVDLVQPGYFKSKTRMLGDYFGIFKNDELVAVAGERMKMNDFVEVSAIVTRPGFTGKGFAKQLTAQTVNNIIDQGKIPYLHVLENNNIAIGLYEKLGFSTRRKISFWKITKNHPGPS